MAQKENINALSVSRKCIGLTTSIKVIAGNVIKKIKQKKIVLLYKIGKIVLTEIK
jgi:hypothetical protein